MRIPPDDFLVSVRSPKNVAIPMPVKVCDLMNDLGSEIVFKLCCRQSKLFTSVDSVHRRGQAWW
jgi:predicted phosphoribosyltransferase